MGRAGKLDFSIDRVRAADCGWIPLHYTVNKKSGGSHAVNASVMTAGAAILFWPTVRAFLLIKGKDVTVNRKVVFDTFTDGDHTLGAASSANSSMRAGMSIPPQASAPANVTVTSNVPGAGIEVDGAYVASTPTTVPLTVGTHQIAVKQGASVWQHSLLVNAGGAVNVNAQVDQMQAAAVRRTTR